MAFITSTNHKLMGIAIDNEQNFVILSAAKDPANRTGMFRRHTVSPDDRKAWKAATDKKVLQFVHG